MTTVAGPAGDAEAPSRRRSLAETIGSLPAPGAKVSLDTVFLTVGALCLPIGLVVIILGWYGVAHTGHLYEQNSYLISGGFLGLALVFVGAALYFSYWMARQIRVTETTSQQTLRALVRLHEELRLVTGPAEDNAATDVLVVTSHGSMVHRPTCPAVAGRVVRVVDDPSAYRACTICMSD
ncbi:MAG: hypothetical protein JO148_14590 [Acidimicrobiia bacterium]|nr:hypothetical protein [Acidimicrobiia bacterium]